MTIVTRAALLRHSFTHSDYYRGTRDDLIAVGLVAAGMFPGDPGRNKTTQKHAGPPTIHVRRCSRNTFEVRVDADPDEAERREERDAARKALTAANEKRQRELDGMPKSADDHRQRMLRLVGTMLQITLDHERTAGVGYRFDPDALEAVETAIADVGAAFRNGRVLFDAAVRRRRVQELHNEAAGVDAGFQTFMAGLR